METKSLVCDISSFRIETLEYNSFCLFRVRRCLEVYELGGKTSGRRGVDDRKVFLGVFRGESFVLLITTLRDKILW